jgi:Family of unknown function (DUF6519)
MQGDFSRIRLSKGKGYTSVLEQQGRVALDADANEQQFLAEGLRRTETVDVIGQFGGPAGDEGFAINGSGGDITIGAGRYYVAGLLCENPAQLSFDSQPYLKVPAGTAADLLANLPGGQQVIQVYLQAWQRLVTALDDPCLGEPALGQADTTARLQTVWRVMARLAAADANAGSYCSAVKLDQPAPSTGTLTVTPGGAAADCGCGPIAAAGYQGLENQLYRVEIQGGGDETQATFRWSRENACVVAAVTAVSGASVQVDSVGPDPNLGFSVGDWVELTDDTWTFGPVPSRPGTLYQILEVHKDTSQVKLATPVTGIDPGQNARMRRWDQTGPSASASGVRLPVAPAVMELENGIQVSFGAGSYQAGDYWTIPARAATGTIEWPPCGSANGSTAQPPCSPEVHEAPLAVLHWVERLIRPPAKATVTQGTVVREALNPEAAREPLAARPVSAPAALLNPGRDPVTGLPVFNPRPGRGHGPVEFGFVRTEDCRAQFSPLTALTPPKSPRAVHVQGISWVNDDVMTLDTLVANPLTVTLDQPVAGPVNSGNFIVTVEPVLQIDQRVSPGSALAFRSVEVVETDITPAGQVLSWALPEGMAQRLQAPLSTMAEYNQFARVRVRLPGHAYFAADAAGPIYLDGRALGQPGTRADGVTHRVDLSLPSGYGSATSDFESWFYLAPVQGISQVGVSPQPLTVLVNPNGLFIGVELTGTTGAVNPAGYVYLAYPALGPVTVALSLTSDGGGGTAGGTVGVGTIVTIPASVTVPAGSRVGNFQTRFGAGPPWATTITFTLTATVSSAVSGWSNQLQNTFQVTTPPAPVPVLQ